ncbi:MAG TPA: hypothetical protein VJK30_05825 [Coxiellaceae bacterium]|nr:hypothetical protein [Coxiellaceae bacterium]
MKKMICLCSFIIISIFLASCSIDFAPGKAYMDTNAGASTS